MVCMFLQIILAIVWHAYFWKCFDKPKQFVSFNDDTQTKEKDNFSHCCITSLKFSHLCDGACVFLMVRVMMMAQGILQKQEFNFNTGMFRYLVLC